MRMKKWQRTLLIGFIWGIIWLWWIVRCFLLTNWYFDIFKIASGEGDGIVGWMFLIDEFRKGWVINNTGTVIFFITLICAFPIYFFGWRYFLKIEWLKLLRRNVNRLIYFFTGAETVRKSNGTGFTLTKKSSKTIRPRALESSIERPASKESELKVPVEAPNVPNDPKPTSAMYGSGNTSGSSSYKPASESPFNKGLNLPSMQQGFSIAPSQNSMASFGGNNWDNDFADGLGGGDMDDILLSDIKLPERVNLDEDVQKLFENAGYTVIRGETIEGIPVEYLAISANRVVVAVEDAQEGDWLADEERFNGEDPLWFSESSHRVSPVFQLLEMVKNFMGRLSESGFSGSVVPMFIERLGMIINAEDMEQTWKDLSIVVCRTGMGGPDELKSVEQSIIQGEPASDIVISQVRSALG